MGFVRVGYLPADYPCPSVAQSQTSKADRAPEKTAIWPRMDTDTHGCGALAYSRSTGRGLEQNYMVMFWQNTILEGQAQCQLQDARVAGAGDAHEVGAILRRGRVVEIDPVQRIEHFEAEL